MKFIKILVMISLSLSLFACAKENNKNVDIETSSSKISNDSNIEIDTQTSSSEILNDVDTSSPEVDAQTNSSEKFSNVEIEYNSKKEIATQKNLIENKNNITTVDNSKNVINLSLRNETIATEYKKSIDFHKKFALKNNLNLNFVEPITDKISRFNNEEDNNLYLLLSKLYENGAETVNYFTNQEGLNIDLSTFASRDANTYLYIISKASIENIDPNFNFKDSKLNEFRKGLVSDKDLDFEKLDAFIYDSLFDILDKDMVFFNKIDDDKYEIIRVEGNNCYYRLVYDPKL